MHNLLFALFLVLPLTVVLAGIPGVLLAGLTLKPVNSMINTLRQITAENLKLKIHIPDTKDEIKRLADTFNDMIERLDRSFSSQQNFIQDISYELKMPLLTLMQDVKAALKKPHSKEEYDNILRRGLEEAEKFSFIIEELLMLAKFDNSQMPLEIKKIDLTKLIGIVAGEARHAAEEKDIALSSFLQDTIILDGDELQLKTLFTNLLDNAIKYTLRKGKIVVAVHKDKKFAKIAVSDTGIGMPEDELTYIFDRFYQINKTRIGKGSFGLGLSIAKSIVESHKGKIFAESQLGEGSVFMVTLPISYPG
jgi:signal transduction histidine kinase